MADLEEYRIQSTGTASNFNITEETRKNPYIVTRINGQDVKVYGTQEQLDTYQNKKPDGTQKQPTAEETAVAKGFIRQVAFKQEAAVNNIDEDGKGDIEESSQETNAGTSGTNLNGLVPNPLDDFASINHLWTLAVLTPKQFNNPNLYRNAVGFSFASQNYDVSTTQTILDPVLGNDEEVTRTSNLSSSIVFSSAGRADAERVNTAFGTPEYFINNFEMVSVIAANPKTGNQNAISFTFEIYEPYSMGLLLQSLQNAAIKAGYVNYLDSPFLLKLDIIGFEDNSQVKQTIKPKYFILKLKKVTFNVDETGSKYAVEAYPYNYQGFSDTVDTAFTDINISVSTGTPTVAFNQGLVDERGTVKDVLATGNNSLVALLNKNEELNVQQGRYKIKDRYEIHFPETPDQRFTNFNEQSNDSAGATADPEKSSNKTLGGTDVDATTSKNVGSNPISKSDFGFDVKKGGNFPFKNDKDVVDEETKRVIRGIMQVDEKNRSFHFTQKQKLTDIITQVILSSTWAKQATQKATKADGMIDWFKIDVQVEFLDYDVSIGDFAKKFIYRVVPFKVHSSIFGNPNSIPVGYSELEKQIVKKYEYIYTGQNTEILDFNIEINYLFYSGANPQSETKTKTEQKPDQTNTVEGKPFLTKTNTGNETAAQAANLGKSKVKKNPNLFSIMRGGSGDADVEQKIAENFYDAFINVTSSDLVKVDLTIMGDTYYLVDSGLSNYFSAPSSQSSQLTEDGTMNYEAQDVYIYLTFRTPADINEKTGLVEFSNKDKVSPFSGIYRVVRCTSRFEDGKFTQELRCIRMQGQPTDYDGKNLNTNKETSTTVIEGESKEKTNVSEETKNTEDDFLMNQNQEEREFDIELNEGVT